jgi:hypothetical protein
MQKGVAVLSHHHLRQAALSPQIGEIFRSNQTTPPTTKVNKSVHLAPTRRTILAAGILSVAMIFAAPTTEAASITWGGAQNIAGDSDVSTSGTLVGAINIGAPGVANTTVNGVLSTGLALTATTSLRVTSTSQLQEVLVLAMASVPRRLPSALCPRRIKHCCNLRPRLSPRGSLSR